MPLSDREQRILEEIEKSLYAEDPTFARQVKRRVSRSAERRRLKIGIAIFVAGLATLFAFFASSVILVGVLAFGAMVGGIVLSASSARALLRDAGDDARDRVGRTISGWEQRFKRRRRRGDR